MSMGGRLQASEGGEEDSMMVHMWVFRVVDRATGMVCVVLYLGDMMARHVWVMLPTFLEHDYLSHGKHGKKRALVQFCIDPDTA